MKRQAKEKVINLPISVERDKNNSLENNHALIVFLRNPVLGKVKTRIAKSTSDVEALSIYEMLCKITLDVIENLDAEIHLFYSESIPEQYKNYYAHVQNGKDLGMRMFNAFHQVLKTSTKVLLIGTDCPTLSIDDLQDAFYQLQFSDLVIGPSNDGGYYLIGMKAEHQSLFNNIEWSTAEVFSKTMTIAQSEGLVVSLLKPYSDIDTFEDWKTYLTSIESNL